MNPEIRLFLNSDGGETGRKNELGAFFALSCHCSDDRRLGDHVKQFERRGRGERSSVTLVRCAPPPLF